MLEFNLVTKDKYPFMETIIDELLRMDSAPYYVQHGGYCDEIRFVIGSFKVKVILADSQSRIDIMKKASYGYGYGYEFVFECAGEYMPLFWDSAEAIIEGLNK